MTSDTLRLIATVAFSLAAAALIVAVVLWFSLKIKDVIWFLTGRSAKIATKNFDGAGHYAASKRSKGVFARTNDTPVQVKPRKKATTVEATAPLDRANGISETVPLDNATVPLSEETMPLGDDAPIEGTTLLDNTDDTGATTLLEPSEAKRSDFVITESIVMVHTDERISFNSNKQK